MLDRRSFTLALAAAPLYAGPLIWLAEDDARLVEALADQIVPADDAPGALAAGVIYYIAKQLAGPLKRYQEVYRRSLPLFRAACREKTGHEFTALAFAERTAFLHSIENGGQPALGSFFAMVVDHTLQGFYGSPEHGGNRGEASWKMLGIEDVMGGHGH
jgi:gluconate 2-dehydrogenase gamma chain